MMNRVIQLLVLHLTVGISFQSCTHGHKNNDGCVPETCNIQGLWIPHKDTIFHTICKKCEAWADPHFTAFSGAQFAWHGEGYSHGCNYALVQDGTSLYPDFGVFMDFKRIGYYGHIGSPTTYRDDKNTEVVLYPNKKRSELFNVYVKGKKQVIRSSNPILVTGTSGQVFAWKHSVKHPNTGITVSPCLRIYGKSKILVELCETIINIWAPPQGPHFNRKLGGLCGSTDATALQKRELVPRNSGGQKFANPEDWNVVADESFGLSWRAKAQTKALCQKRGEIIGGKRKRSPREQNSEEHLHMKCLDYVNHNNSFVGQLSVDHHNLCLGVHHKGNEGTGDDHHDACMYDLCIVANDPAHREANFTVERMLGSHHEVHARTRVHIDNAISQERIPGGGGGGGGRPGGFGGGNQGGIGVGNQGGDGGGNQGGFGGGNQGGQGGQGRFGGGNQGGPGGFGGGEFGGGNLEGFGGGNQGGFGGGNQGGFGGGNQGGFHEANQGGPGGFGGGEFGRGNQGG